MIFRSIGPGEIFYRIHTPRWAYRPLSGAGAAMHGGRFNRPGLEALYLSSDMSTAAAEFQQEAALLSPGTLVAYRTRLTRIVDLSAGYQPESWGLEWQDWDCDWRALIFDQRIIPPSWDLGDLALAAGARAILFPSLKRPEVGALNLVVYPHTVAKPEEVTVHDPNGELPTDQSSWPK